MTFVCLHRAVQTFGNALIDSPIMVREISLAIFTIAAFSESRFWNFWVQARSSSTDYNLQFTELWSGLEECQSSTSMKSGTCSRNHFCVFFSLFEWVQNLAESTTHFSPQIQFPPEVVRHHLTWLGGPHRSFLHRYRKKILWWILRKRCPCSRTILWCISNKGVPDGEVCSCLLSPSFSSLHLKFFYILIVKLLIPKLRHLHTPMRRWVSCGSIWYGRIWK